jgi:hypothetical protein
MRREVITISIENFSVAAQITAQVSDVSAFSRTDCGNDWYSSQQQKNSFTASRNTK